MTLSNNLLPKVLPSNFALAHLTAFALNQSLFNAHIYFADAEATAQPPSWSVRAELIHGLALVDAVNRSHLLMQVVTVMAAMSCVMHGGDV